MCCYILLQRHTKYQSYLGYQPYETTTQIYLLLHYHRCFCFFGFGHCCCTPKREFGLILPEDSLIFWTLSNTLFWFICSVANFLSNYFDSVWNSITTDSNNTIHSYVYYKLIWSLLSFLSFYLLMLWIISILSVSWVGRENFITERNSRFLL